MATGLENELTQKEKYDLIMADMDAQFAAYGTTNPFADSFSYTQDDLPYNTDENGVMYNDDGERVYFYQGSQESANGTQDNPSEMDKYGDAGYYDNVRIGAKRAQGKFLTQAQIEEQWNGGEMNQFRDAHPDMDFDTYWSYIEERQGLIESGELSNGLRPTDEEFWSEDGEWLGNDAYSDDLNNEAYTALLDKYGIKGKYYDEDGNGYVWNGSGYTKIYDVPKADFRDYALMATSAVAGLVAGPAIASALTPTLGAAGAKAASAAIVNMAKQYVTTGELDWGDALLAAATSYGGAQLSEALNGSGVIGDIGSQINDFGNSLMEGGGDILSAALQAGGMSLVTQMVQEGEIDWKDAAIAAAMAGGSAALKGFLADIGKEGAESEVLEEITVTAQRKGTQVGEGLWQLDDGTVISDTGNVLGNMESLDLDGDGVLNGNDLQDIDVNHDFVDPNPNENVYGDVDLAPPDSTTNPTAFTKEWANERYGSLSEGQTVAAMQRDGFTDEQIDAYLEGRYDDIDAINPNIVTHAGGWVENMEQPYTLEYRDGRHYIIMDGKLKAISEDAYTDLYADLESGGDWQQTMNDYGVTSGGEVFGGYDEYGRPIYNQSEMVDDWITLDGTQPPVTAPIDAFTEETPETENPQTSTDQESADGDANNDSPTGDPNDSTEQGQGPTGGGETNEQGGDGSGGMLGGGGLPSSSGSTGGSSGGGNTGEGTVGGSGDTGAGGESTGVNDNSAGTGDNNTDNGAGSGNATDGTDNSNTDGSNVGGEGGTGSGGGSGAGTGTNVGGNTGETTDGSGAGSGTSGDTGGGATTGGSTGAGAGTDAGTNGGSNGGDNTGGSTGAGTGSGTGAGSGGGSGGGGAGGGGLGSGQGMLSGTGGNANPEWGPLFPGTQFKPRQKGPQQVKARLFEDLFKDYMA